MYGLPERPELPSRKVGSNWLIGWGSAIVGGLLGALSLRKSRMDERTAEAREAEEARR